VEVEIWKPSGLTRGKTEVAVVCVQQRKTLTHPADVSSERMWRREFLDKIGLT
jgi:hypothetical protein